MLYAAECICGPLLAATLDTDDAMIKTNQLLLYQVTAAKEDVAGVPGLGRLCQHWVKASEAEDGA